MHLKDCQHAAVADDDYMDEDDLASMMSMFNFIFMRSGSGVGGRAGFSMSLGGPFGGGGGGYRTPSRS